jgi:hypothetical protein
MRCRVGDTVNGSGSGSCLWLSFSCTNTSDDDDATGGPYPGVISSSSRCRKSIAESVQFAVASVFSGIRPTKSSGDERLLTFPPKPKPEPEPVPPRHRNDPESRLAHAGFNDRSATFRDGFPPRRLCAEFALKNRVGEAGLRFVDCLTTSTPYLVDRVGDSIVTAGVNSAVNSDLYVTDVGALVGVVGLELTADDVWGSGAYLSNSSSMDGLLTI